MKTRNRFWTIGLLVFVFVLISACALGAAPVPPPPDPLPLWKGMDPNDIAGSMGISKDTHVITYEVSMNINPKFYKGPGKLSYTSNKLLLSTDIMPTFINEFSDFTVLYGYDDRTLMYNGIATKAVVFDGSKQVIAEARLEEGDGRTLTLLEVHYDTSGNVIFWCHSTISTGLGDKIDEYDVNGVKAKEYFFLWPVSAFN